MEPALALIDLLRLRADLADKQRPPEVLGRDLGPLLRERVVLLLAGEELWFC